MGDWFQFGHQPLVQRTIRAYRAEPGEVDDDAARRRSGHEAAEAIRTARDDAAAVAAGTAQMGQWPVVDDDGGETCGDDGATATDIAYAGCAQGVDLGIGGSGNDGRGAVSGNRTDMHVAETGYWDHAIPFLGVGLLRNSDDNRSEWHAFLAGRTGSSG